MEKNMPKQGEFVWNELMAQDVKKAQEFYRSLLGWEFEENDMGKMKYTKIITAGKQNGGMVQISSDQAGQIPPHWLTYVYVDDLDQSLKKAKTLGATIKVPATPAGEIGHFAIIVDPAGAHIGLWQCTKSCG